MKKTILILGAERSGTNLVRSILHSHSEVFFPHTAGIIEEFSGNEQYYKSKEFFVEDVLKLIEFDHDPWEWFPTKDEIVKELTEISSYEIKRIIYQKCCKKFNTNVIGIKNINYINHFEGIKKHFNVITIRLRFNEKN